MKAIVVILFIVLILVIGWFVFAGTGPRRVRRVVERPAPSRVLRRRTTVVEDSPTVPEESPGVAEERRIID
ncbi:MAG: hypothetical protein ABJA34_09855 [Pseudonocardiales bacterium]